MLRQKLFRVANGVGAEVENARGEDGVGFAFHFLPLKLFRESKRQTAFAVEQFLQPPVAGTALAPDDSGRDKLAALAARASAFEPVFPTD